MEGGRFSALTAGIKSDADRHHFDFIWWKGRDSERSGTLFFSFQDLDSTKPAGSVKIRVETIAYYLDKYSAGIVANKKRTSPPRCPLNDA